MRPHNLKTKIFLDSGDPQETQEIYDMLGFLDGQTTNPSLVAKNPELSAVLDEGKKLSSQELLHAYKKIIQQIYSVIPGKSISIEVYADTLTPVDTIIEQAQEMNTWVDTAHIKIPMITHGLQAAEQLLQLGMHLNFTLVFSQEQAAAIASLARNIRKGDVFISPFEGRLHDHGQDGMDLIENIMTMYRQQHSTVEVLAASIRDVEHLKVLLAWNVDIVTVPFNILKQWAQEGMDIPSRDSIPTELHDKSVANIPYQSFDITKSWNSFDIQHELTNQGLKKFIQDWNNLLK